MFNFFLPFFSFSNNKHNIDAIYKSYVLRSISWILGIGFATYRVTGPSHDTYHDHKLIEMSQVSFYFFFYNIRYLVKYFNLFKAYNLYNNNNKKKYNNNSNSNKHNNIRV